MFSKKGFIMWTDKLREFTIESGIPIKEVAERAMISEKTINRMLEGKAKTIYADTLERWCNAIGVSMADIFADSKAVIGTENLATLQDKVEIKSAEMDMLIAENKILQDKVVALTAEVDLLKMRLAHKEEIISIHNYYCKKLSTTD
jgi:DNA-binding Xre family transcriptional regulator